MNKERKKAQKYLYNPKAVLSILGLILKNKKIIRPRGKKLPRFSIEEVRALMRLLLFRSPYVVLRVYERLSKEREYPFKRQKFINYFIGEANFNAAKAARMAGYSPRSAKQIAYKIKQS